MSALNSSSKNVDVKSTVDITPLMEKNNGSDEPFSSQKGENLAAEDDVLIPSENEDEIFTQEVPSASNDGSAEDSEEESILFTQPVSSPAQPSVTFSGKTADSFNIPLERGAVHTLGHSPKCDYALLDQDRSARGELPICSRFHASLQQTASGMRVICMGPHGIVINRGDKSFTLMPEAAERAKETTRTNSAILLNNDCVRFGAGIDPTYLSLEFTVSIPEGSFLASRRARSPSAAAALPTTEEECVDPEVAKVRAQLLQVADSTRERLLHARTLRSLGAVAGQASKELKSGPAAASTETASLIVRQQKRKQKKKERQAIKKCAMEASLGAAHQQYMGQRSATGPSAAAAATTLAISPRSPQQGRS